MSIRILLFICLTFISVMILSSNCVYAQELNSAKVIYIEGSVEIRRQPNDQPQIQKVAFKIDDELRAGDTIITGKNGRLVLGLSDGSQAVIAPQTTVIIKDLSQSPRTLFNVIRGKTRVHIEKLGGQPNPYRVNTPTAVIAVRGTIFDVLVEKDETQVFLHEGEVAVINPVLPDQPVMLTAGQTTRVLLQHLPTIPIPFKVGRNDGSFQWKMRIDTNGPRPDFERGSIPPSGAAKPDFGRVGKPAIDGAKPDFDRGMPSKGRIPKANPKTAGKKH